MGILNNDKITQDYLTRSGFWSDGWGSPYTRKVKNTTMWEKIEHWYGKDWEVMHFPPEFEGQVCPGTWYPVNVSGRIMMSQVNNNDYYISPIIEDITDFEVYVTMTLRKKTPKFDKLKHQSLKDYILTY